MNLNVKCLTAVLLLLVACGVDRGDGKPTPPAQAAAPAEAAAGIYVLGSDLTSDGAIAENAVADSFVRGGPIFLSIDVGGATTDQRIEVAWSDVRGRVVHRDQRLVREGTRYVAFTTGATTRWMAGPYRVLVTIDGRRVNEQSFPLIA